LEFYVVFRSIHSFINSTNYRGTLVWKHCLRAERLPVKVTTHMQTTASLGMRGAILPLPHRTLSLFLRIGPNTTNSPPDVTAGGTHSSHCVERQLTHRPMLQQAVHIAVIVFKRLRSSALFPFIFMFIMFIVTYSDCFLKHLCPSGLSTKKQYVLLN